MINENSTSQNTVKGGLTTVNQRGRSDGNTSSREFMAPYRGWHISPFQTRLYCNSFVINRKVEFHE
jgi:hypothetical protein